MNTKLLMIEGIPGSGKSTFAKKIADYYKDKGVKVNLYVEGQMHPADLAWCALVPLDLLDILIIKYPDLEKDIRKNMLHYKSYAIIAYTQIKTDNYEFYKELESYEVYDNRIPFDKFCEINYDRWQSFGEQAFNKDELNIFECAFLQNHVNEMLNFQLSCEKNIEVHLNKLISYVLNLSPVLIYLSQDDIRETIDKVSKERVSEDGNWIDMAINYVENSPFGKLNNLRGLDGFIYQIENRKNTELDIIKTLPIKTIIVENKDYDWEKVWQDIKAFLDTLD